MNVTATDIRSIINQGENLHIEFKASFQKQVIETVVAFANAKGGKIFIGIDDQGQVTGVSVTQETIQNHIKNKQALLKNTAQAYKELRTSAKYMGLKHRYLKNLTTGLE